jgi:hypothetical protein
MEAVLLDTCVLLKSYLCDTLLSIAEEGVYRPLWSERTQCWTRSGGKHPVAAGCGSGMHAITWASRAGIQSGSRRESRRSTQG